MFEKLPLFLKKTLAWSVHLFTATGAIWGFLSLLAIFEEKWRVAIIWIIIAMFVDGFDGMLARWFHVKEYAKGVDGGLMDNIIDYLNYVVVAALILIKAPNLMPAGLELASAFSILLTSAYGMADEIRQSFTPGRSVEIADWVADTLGACLAVSLYQLWGWYRRLLETPLFTRKQRVEKSPASVPTEVAP